MRPSKSLSSGEKLPILSQDADWEDWSYQAEMTMRLRGCWKICDDAETAAQASDVTKLRSKMKSLNIDVPPSGSTRSKTAEDEAAELAAAAQKAAEKEKLESEIYGYLGLSLPPSLRALARSCSTGSELWVALKKRFEGEKRARVARLWKQYEELAVEKDDVPEFLERVDHVVGKLVECGKVVDEEQTLNKVFKAMPLSYDLVVLQLENENAKWSEVKPVLMKHAGKLIEKKANQVGPGGTAFMVKGRSWRSGEVQKKCTLCENDGHTRRNCPDIECHKCNGKGHISIDCKKKQESEAEEDVPKGRSMYASPYSSDEDFVYSY